MLKKIIAEKPRVSGQIPAPRFGHSFTMVSQDKAILFGGAVSITGKFVITNETYLFDFTLMQWKKINFKQGFVPTERAAHAAVKVSDMQIIIYGGAASGSQGLLKDQLYILDLRKQPTWKIIEVVDKSLTPGQRYGHTMVFNKPYLIVFGGNSGNKAENDVWLLNINKGPFQWQRYEFKNKIAPCPRVYHSAAICDEGSAQGMMVVFGGRKDTKRDHNGSKTDSNAALNDIWGLRRHRDGSWDWVTPPKSETYTPICRYQHLVTFMGSMLVIVGGRSNHPQQVVDAIQIYDTQTSEWYKAQSVSRYRHAIALYNKNKLFVHGGFQPQLTSQPLQDMAMIDLTKMFYKQPKENIFIDNSLQSALTQRIQSQRKQLRQIGQSERNIVSNSRIRADSKLNHSRLERERDLTPSRIINSSKNIRLSSQVVVAKGQNNLIQIQKMNVNELLEESKKLTEVQQDSQCYDLSVLQLIDSVINVLMPVQSNQLKNFALFPFKKDKIIRLCQETVKILSQETSLVGCRSPAKVFGSLYGRYQDLLNIFQNFGFPDDKQMQTMQYVFLGDYVDKGFNSLETICLLMALKIKYPDHIHLIRGKHQDINVNRIGGFGEECAVRLGENINEPSSCFALINAVFELLPLAVAIQDKYLCLNSGIGTVPDLLEVKDVQRPVKIKNNQIVTDILWSQQEGCQQLGYVSRKATEDQLQDFFHRNGVEMIINAKNGIKGGVEDDGLILSVSTIPNYNNGMNRGCILKITKELQIAPCIVTGNGVKRTAWINEVNVKVNMTLNEKQVEFRRKIFAQY